MPPPAVRRRRLDTLSSPLRPVPFSYRLHKRMDALDQIRGNQEPFAKLNKVSSKMLPPLFLEPPVSSKPPPPTCSIEAEEAEVAARAAAEAVEAAAAEAMRPKGDRESLGVAASTQGKLRMSSSLPTITQSKYKPLRGIIYGGSEYQRANREGRGALPPATSRYLSFLPTEEDTLRKARERKKKVHEAHRKLKDEIRSNAGAFHGADKNLDGMLDFDEFCKLMEVQLSKSSQRPVAPGLKARKEDEGDKPKGKGEGFGMPTREMLRDWFRVVDFNCDGRLTLTEFFAFSLREALARALDGRGLDPFFRLWDSNHDGSLDKKELASVSHELGFDAITNELLRICDEDHNGLVSLGDMTRALRLRTSGKTDKAVEFVRMACLAARSAKEETSRWGILKRQLTLEGAHGFTDTAADEAEHRKLREALLGRTNGLLDAHTALAITAALGKVDLTKRKDAFYDATDESTRKSEDVAPALAILRSWMRQQGLRALDTFQSWDIDGSYLLTRHELGRGFKELGLHLSKELLTLIFDYLAEGHHLTYDEWKGWYETTSKFELGSGGPEDEGERRRLAAVTIQRRVRQLLERKRKTDESFGRRRAQVQPRRNELTPEELHERLYRVLWEEKEKVLNTFRRLDADQDGKVDAAEFARVVTEMGLDDSESTMRAAEQLFATYDLDHNGALDYNELWKHLRKRLHGGAPAIAPASSAGVPAGHQRPGSQAGRGSYGQTWEEAKLPDLT